VKSYFRREGGEPRNEPRDERLRAERRASASRETSENCKTVPICLSVANFFIISSRRQVVNSSRRQVVNSSRRNRRREPRWTREERRDEKGETREEMRDVGFRGKTPASLDERETSREMRRETRAERRETRAERPSRETNCKTVSIC
jgi:hypothetical protein